MILIDSHTHLYLEDYNDDSDAMIARALQEGVRYMLLPHIDSRTTAAVHELADRYPDHCIPMMGIHPTSVKENYREEIALVEENLKNRKYCAIGEVGIDLYWDKTHAKEQEECFHHHIGLALEHQLPLVVHSRNSMQEVLQVLEHYRGSGLKGVLHCFPGNTEEALQGIELGFMLGIGGVVTYKKSTMASVVADIDLENILLETDAPFLTPSPHRGKRNESAFVIHVAEKIAEIKGVTTEEVAAITTTNAIKLFNLPELQ